MANFNGTGSNDTYSGGSDADSILGNGGDDTLSGGGGKDTIAGNAGSDQLDGGDGNDMLYSGDVSPAFVIPYFTDPWNAPLLDTGSEHDTLAGSNGDDRIFAGYGDNVDGGANSDVGDYLYISFKGASSGISADFLQPSQTIGGATITGIENVSWVQGSDYDDSIKLGGPGAGFSDFTAVFAGGGNDHVTAGYYTGTIYGEAGDDLLDGRGSQYLMRVDGGDGNDTLYTSINGSGVAYGGNGTDTIYANGEAHGGAGDDHIVMQLTFYPMGHVTGDEGNDTIDGVTNYNGFGNTIAGGAGSDVITGGDNSDLLFSGDFAGSSNTPADDYGLEHDRLSGGGSNDILAIGYGDDVDGGAGNDTLYLSLGGASSGVTVDLSGITTGPFTLGGGTIQNVELLYHLTGSNFSDTITVGTQPALLTIDAGAGDDAAIASGSAVDFRGQEGNDTFVSGTVGDRFDGGDGFDTANYSQYGSGIAVTLGATSGADGSGPGGDVLVRVEQVLGTVFADTLVGSNNDDALVGNDGADSLNGQSGHDVLLGGVGADTISGGDGNDHIYGQSAAGGADTGDSLSGGTGLDYIQGNAGNDTIDGGAQGDRINGGADNDLIAGGDGYDTVNGNMGNDTITGDTGSDSLRGGQGDDQIAGGDGDDTLSGDLGTDRLTGGAGADLFRFGGMDSSVGGTLHDEITDFTHNTDHIALPFVPGSLIIGAAVDQGSAAAAANAAMAAHAGFQEAAAIQVGGDTYLFASATGASDTADMMIKLDGVTASQLSLSDFV